MGDDMIDGYDVKLVELGVFWTLFIFHVKFQPNNAHNVSCLMFDCITHLSSLNGL